jgi:radical SAM protein with 4Fe4S-binding SPASM domain
VKQIQRREYLRRHVFNLYPYLTLYKLWNLFLNLIERRLLVTKPRSTPPFIKIEPTSVCQLKCPGCQQHMKDGKYFEHEKREINLQEFITVIEPIKNGLLGISLSFQGEPLLNPQLPELITWAHSHNIAVTFPSNLSVELSDEFLRKLVTARPDTIFVSLDGASVETYSKYRVGGDFSLILRNVKKINAIKRQFGFSRPRIVWKYVIFEHNKHEVGMVRKHYRNLGFDDFEMVSNRYGSDAKKSRKEYSKKTSKRGKGCYWLWHSMVIMGDGRVLPCCSRKEFQIGNAISCNSRQIWESPQYQKIRRGFSKKAPMHPICAKCWGVEN